MISNKYFRTYLGSIISRERKLNNALPQGSVLAPLLFNLYISDLPETRAKGLGLTETTLSEDLASLCTYFKKWRLKAT
ncbi:hypothetical protein D910_05802 [Dendroctonus ponderosae]|uniref:Reverse transcriptase domain-containing protein n=1 Tax=Dendroctonus ponderosae TaxID=77166 RepID=U4UCV9_DENPD|nr:hypothetical protein D910_05802 [Dendroctonus ponderosae]